MGDVFVFGCVSVCWYVSVCVVFDVLPSMRRLLCGGDGSKKRNLQKQKETREGMFFTITVQIYSKKLDPHQITNITVFINPKNSCFRTIGMHKTAC